MKLKNIFFIGTLAVAGLTSCVSENVDSNQSAGEGSMALSVTALEPVQTRTQTPVTNFPVTVYDTSGNTVVSWNTVSEVPSNYPISVGNYTVESHTPGAIQKRMSAPYYKGTADMEITKDVTTNVTVVCKMQNSSITVRYDEDFLSVFTAWSVTLDDGSDSNIALSFTNADGTTPATVYWLFEENVRQLTLNFRGTTKDGSVVTARNVLTKAQAQESYDDDSEYFTGGDAIVINFTPVESTSGNVTGITINATVTFAESEETVTLLVTDEGTLEPDPGPGPGPGPGDDDEDEDKPYFVCPELTTGVTFSAAADEADLPQTQVKIYTPKGLKSLKVTVTGGNVGFASATGFLTNLEIIGSEDLGEIFGEVEGAELPNQGDTEYVFPVYAFYNLIQMFGPTDADKAHEFYMVAEDLQGNVIDGTLRVTVTE